MDMNFGVNARYSTWDKVPTDQDELVANLNGFFGCRTISSSPSYVVFTCSAAQIGVVHAACRAISPDYPSVSVIENHYHFATDQNYKSVGRHINAIQPYVVAIFGNFSPAVKRGHFSFQFDGPQPIERHNVWGVRRMKSRTRNDAQDPINPYEKDPTWIAPLLRTIVHTQDQVLCLYAGVGGDVTALLQAGCNVVAVEQEHR
jgi:hypothetical protein